MVPIAVLPQSKLVLNTDARSVSAALPNLPVTRPRHAYYVVTKSNSPIRRYLLRSSSSKTSTSPPRVTAAKTLVLNGGYVAFGGNPKGGKITGKGKINTGNLVRGLPIKVFKNDNSCVACKKANNIERLGIKREFCVPKTPQQNGIAERKNNTLIETARTMLADSLLHIPFWAEAVNTTCYVQNRVLVTKPYNKTPYELLHGRPPSISLMRPFGCPVTILNTLDHLGKFQGKVDEGFLVGYSVCSKAFRVFNSRTRIVHETLRVNFMENKPNVAGTGPTWLFDIDSLSRTMNYHPVSAENQPNSDADALVDEKEHDVDTQTSESAVIHSSSSSVQTRKQVNKTERENKGKIPIESFTRYRDLNAKFEECSNNSSNGVNAASSTVPTVGHNFINNTNIFSAAGPSNTAVSPTYENSSFTDASTSSHDPAMPDLEDLTYYDDNDVVGAEANINNLESSLPINPIPTTRIHKDHPISQIIGDLSLTTQTRSMARAVKDQGIDNDIYSVVDACANACKMWKAIERQRFVTLVKKSQELKTVSYHKLYDILKQHQNEVNEIRAEKITRVANPLALVAQQHPVYNPQNNPTHYTQNSSTSSQQAATRNKRKAIVNSPQPIYDQEPSMIAEDDETSKYKEIDKLMALISLSFKKIYKPTNNNIRTSFNTSRANQDNSLRINRGTGIQCYNCKEFGHVARECQKPKRVKDVAYHRERMLLCKQEEARIQLNAEKADWKDDTDDESDDQELEAHYMYMAKFQEVSPDAADSGPIFDTEPVQKVSTDYHYNVFAIKSEHHEQSKTVHDIYPIKQDEHNVIIDSLDMSYDSEQIDQNDDDANLVNEHELLTSLIEKLECEINESKNRNKFLETSNKIKLYKTRDDNKLNKVTALENKVKVLDNIVYKTSTSVQTMNMLNSNCQTSFVKPEFLKKAQSANPHLTTMPMAMPVSTREPNQSVEKPIKKTVDSESNQKPRNTLRKLYERIRKTCSWWYIKFTPSGYIWKPKSKIENVNPNIIVIILFIVDSGFSKHMTGNLKLLNNFVEKFLGMVKFRNDQIAPILGYGDLVQGALTIKRVLLGLKEFLSVVEITAAGYGLESVKARLVVYKQNESILEENIQLLKVEVQARASQTNDKHGLGYVSLEDDFASDRFPPSGGYHVVPPLITGNFMPPKPDLFFHTAPIAVKTDHLAFTVKLSLAEPAKDLSHTNRPFAPIIKVWVSDSEEDSKIIAPQIAHSSVQSTKQVTPPRHSIQPVEAPIPAAIPKLTTLKSNRSSKRKNRKTCFVCKSLDHLIKDYDYHAKKKAQPTIRNYAHRGTHKQNASFTHHHPQMHMVHVAVLSQSKPISTAVRPICAAVPKIMATKPRHARSLHTNTNSIFRRHITHGQSPKISNSPLRVTTAQAPVIPHELKVKQSILLVVLDVNPRGLPSKVFTNDNSCVSCKKGKQHRASCKSKTVSSVDQPLFRLHMDLFGPTVVKSLSKKSYCLVITDDYSRFSWVFFLASKDETPPVLKTFIIGLENLLSLKVKIIRCDNRTEFKNADLNQLCGLKGIKREISVPRTPQQNGIGERKNRTLIEAARTLLVDSLLPIPFWAEETLHINFIENKPNVAGSGPAWLFDIDSLSQTMNYHPVIAENQTNSNAGFPDTQKVGEQGTQTYKSVSPDIHSSSSGAQTRKQGDKTENKDKDDVGAEAGINNMESIISVGHIPTTRIHKDHPTSQIIGDLSSTTQTRSMARAVRDQGGISQMFNEDLYTCMFACFLSQEEPKRVHQALKDPIARIEAIRLFLAYASFMDFLLYQMDVKSAFLYGTIEKEVYVCQPPGFEDPENPDKVYKVVKALYGLHQAPKAWYETLATYLLENGFHRGTIDQTLFIKKQQNGILLVQIYVDDIIFGATNKALCQSFEK
nr:putative ribonuclease H-like domain-containing protein [Tanacetum cinerariifolium]